MTKVQQEILLSLINEYANLHRCKAMADDEQYTNEWRYAVRKDTEQNIPIVKRRIELFIKGLL